MSKKKKEKERKMKKNSETDHSGKSGSQQLIKTSPQGADPKNRMDSRSNVEQHVPEQIDARELKSDTQLSQDQRFQTELLLERAQEEHDKKGEKDQSKFDQSNFDESKFNQTESDLDQDLFKMTTKEKIESEFPAEIDDILEVNDGDQLVEHLAYLQRKLMEKNIPVMIILEGAYASGKGRITNELLLGLDARYTDFIGTRPPTEDDLMKPFLTQYLESIPRYKIFNIYYRSWYSMYNYYKNKGVAKDNYKNPEILINEIKAFEKSLADDGYVIIKFKIRIDPQKQQEHIKKMLESPLTIWKAQEYDKDNNETYVREMEKVMKVTDEPWAPWYIVDYRKKSETTAEVIKKVIEILDRRLKKEESKPAIDPRDRDGDFTGKTSGPLDQVDLNKDISDEQYSTELKRLQEQMREVQHGLYIERIPLILVFEGWDAAGKGGAIHRILAKLDPTNYIVNTTAAPNDLEKNHHYLWRFSNQLPRAGHIAIWDLSWYGRVMVERVEGFATDEEWSRAYSEINNFEKIMTNYGAIVLKFYLHIDQATQLARFEARAQNPAKSWKITEEDWRNRDKWDKYTEAVNDLLEKTNDELAPWYIIEGNSKKYARIKILKTIIEACDLRLDSIDYSTSSKKEGKNNGK